MNAKKKFYIKPEEKTIIAEHENINDYNIRDWLNSYLKNHGIKGLNEFIFYNFNYSSNPTFKAIVHCDQNDKFDKCVGKRIASMFSDYKRNNYTIKQINHVINKLHDAIDVLTDYRYKILKRQNEINENLKEYKN